MIDGTLKPPLLSELSYLAELRRLSTQLARVSDGMRGGGRRRLPGVPMQPGGLNLPLGIGVWARVAQTSPGRRVLGISVWLGGPVVISTTPLALPAAPIGIAVASSVPLLMRAEEWYGAQGWEWWVVTSAPGTTITTFELVDV